MRVITSEQTASNSKYRLDHPVVVLYNKTAELIKGEERDRVADQGVVLCAKTIVSALKAMGYEVVDLPFSWDVETVLTPYPANKWIVFNLGEGMAGKLFEEARIAWALEAMGYSFTGNSGDAIALSLNKARAKSVLQASGLKTPEWWLFSSPDEIDPKVADRLPYPLIVKPLAEGGSIGLDGTAVVHSAEALRERVSYLAETYFQSALAERFIVGRELNIAMLGNPPDVLPLAEIDFADFSDPYEKIVSFDAKWKEDSFEYNHTPTICPAELPRAVENRVRRTALKAWDAIGCSGYARVDMRLDQKNIPYVLEVNCNPDISTNAGFHLAARAAGYNYKILISHLLKNARRPSNGYRQSSSTTKWRADFKNN
ncbi:MAG: ATP-grasp domain-containing protein [Anaerolineales bacterium]